MPVSKILANGRSLINKIALFNGKEQILCLMLQCIGLPSSAEYIFVMINFNNFRSLKFIKYLLSPQIPPRSFFNINMRKTPAIIIFF